MNLHLIAIGKIKGAESDLAAEYIKRIRPKMVMHELTPKPATPEAEAKAIFEKIPENAFVIALDERGENMNSRAFAKKFGTWMDNGKPVVFVIGGADGLAPTLKKRADFTLSLGSLTLAHMLARVVLLEQVYRAQTILAGHPYHRD